MILRDVAAERAVLAGICQYGPDAFLDIADIVSEESFAGDNARVFSCLKKLCEQDVAKIDIASIFSTGKEIGLENLFQSSEFQLHVQSLFNFPIHQENIRKLALKIKKLEVTRLLNKTLENIKQKLLEVSGDESLSEILNIAENEILNFASKLDTSSDEPKNIADGLMDYVDYLANNPIDLLGIPTGFPKYDKIIGGGLRGSTVNVIAARSKCGKSILSTNIGFYIASELGIPVLNMDTEMTYTDHLNRLLAMSSESYIYQIETGKFAVDPMAKKRVYEVARKIESKKIPYHHKSVSSMKFEEQLSIMKRWLTKTVGIKSDGKANKCVVVYDYLKVTGAEDLKNLQEYQLIGFMMIKLHEFACKYDIPILMMLQTNRDGLAKEDASIASGGDRIIFNCSNFSVLKFKSPEEIASDGIQHGNRKILNVLSRHGSGHESGDYINCFFDGARATIKEGLSKQEIKDKKKEEQDEVEQDESGCGDFCDEAS